MLLFPHNINMKLKTGQKICYGIGNLGYSVVSQTITNFFMFFGTSVLKVSGSLIGIAIAVSTIWDALCDPFVGYVSDTKSFKVFGNRNGYILLGTIGVSLINLLIWFVPMGLSQVLKFVWVLVALLLNETFCTLYSTPYGALGGDLSSDYNDRTVIQIYKTIFFILGMILPSVLLQIFLPSTPEFPQGQLNPAGYKKIAIVCSLIMLLCGLVCVFGTLKFSRKNANNLSNVKPEKFSFKSLFLGFVNSLKNGQQRLVVFGYSLSMISAAFLTSVGLHFFTYCFNYSSLKITVLLSALLVGMVLSQPFWYKLSLKQDKKPALLTGLLVAICGVIVIMITYILKSVLAVSSFYIILVAIFIVGFGAGTLYSLPTSMYLDVIEYVSDDSSKNSNAATSQSFLTFSYNIANALALLIIGVLLDVIKFNPNQLTQTRPVQTGIAIILFLGVLISLIGSFLLFYRYKLKKKHFENQNKNS